eukprot:FR739573.1.p1 GENE.FR739573.1~~FR739573.1.p1  ORF type:complete len:200 (+),score=1.93 FR739573.1:83-601(+)
MDEHPHQIRYCYCECSVDCEIVPPNVRSNSTLWEDGSIVQCTNIASRMTQLEALYAARTAYAVAVIVCQLAAAIVIKTRWQSVRVLGLDNTVINFGVFIGLIALAYCVYIPQLNLLLETRPLRFTQWLPGIPWAATIVCYDECRKFLMRVTSTWDEQTGKKKLGWMEANSYY